MTTSERLFALEQFGIKLGLDNIRALTAALGHPERAYPTIHVAGTNGKGSVSAMVERALRAEGYRTGLYTSPHLDRIEERVAIDGIPVEGGAFEACASAVLDTAARLRASGGLDVSPTFFEATTALAFEAFRRASVDVAVIEVGLGGRFDATNVVEPLVTAVTSIAFDHERHLGHTLAAIAYEKAGIAKAGVPLVVGELPDEAGRVVQDAAASVGAPVVSAARAIERVEMHDGVATVCVRTGPGASQDVTLALRGRHQAANAAVAVSILDTAAAHGLAVRRASVLTGLSDARWPGRLEWLDTGAGRVLIDAAHNPAGAAALASYLVDAGVAPLPLVLAMMADKDVSGMIAPLAPVASRIVASEAVSPRALPAGALASRLRELVPDLPVEIEPDPLRAVRCALAGGHAAAGGSMYFTGPLRARLIKAGAQSI
ncbi:MAG: Mur ligase family protein [Vicinamibacterales bacterium]